LGRRSRDLQVRLAAQLTFAPLARFTLGSRGIVASSRPPRARAPRLDNPRRRSARQLAPAPVGNVTRMSTHNFPRQIEAGAGLSAVGSAGSQSSRWRRWAFSVVRRRSHPRNSTSQPGPTTSQPETKDVATGADDIADPADDGATPRCRAHSGRVLLPLVSRGMGPTRPESVHELFAGAGAVSHRCRDRARPDRRMEYGGITIGIASWFGPGTTTDTALPALISAARGAASAGLRIRTGRDLHPALPKSRADLTNLDRGTAEAVPSLSHPRLARMPGLV